MALYTVFGGRGFIGSEIVGQLEAQGHSTFVPVRDDCTVFERDLGIVIYCAGNGDCKNSPFSVFEANVTLLANLLQKAHFDRLIYVSSTRLYMNGISSNEQANLTVCVNDNRRLFNLTKLVAEELCLNSGRNVCIVRPSNVYGVALNSALFLPSIIRNAINNGKVDMFITKDYAKDYVSVLDVASVVISLVQSNNTAGEIFNVAAGYNISAEKIADLLVEKTNCSIVWHDINSQGELFPITDISKLVDFMPDFKPKDVLFDFANMIDMYKAALT
ncbi:NAD-dependent epimerase/dehydratase family protein [Shewanella baltica]|uniref:NAD-dependent epimerase/dehydratase family protein n=1 Tax=Shewanella baltica TaxID=62322 RepID=UPI00217D239E|nr:SDR family oxidoreductase [Shewanella baltica]MCS6098301.1 SDR family oxidoreductase [Shewanella baltica]MCS6181487.1 SDR family oxidoreductase [Shewanella baltica]